VTRGHSDIDSNPEWITRLLGIVRLFHHHVAAANVIAKAIEPRGFVANEFVELI
jgi:hypothetical protein